jgi:hypothetical protein
MWATNNFLQVWLRAITCFNNLNIFWRLFIVQFQEWWVAMCNEHQSLVKNNTYSLLADCKLMCCKSVDKTKTTCKKNCEIYNLASYFRFHSNLWNLLWPNFLSNHKVWVHLDYYFFQCNTIRYAYCAIWYSHCNLAHWLGWGDLYVVIQRLCIFGARIESLSTF